MSIVRMKGLGFKGTVLSRQLESETQKFGTKHVDKREL